MLPGALRPELHLQLSNSKGCQPDALGQTVAMPMVSRPGPRHFRAGENRYVPPCDRRCTAKRRFSTPIGTSENKRGYVCVL